MKIALQCKSILMEKSLRQFLKHHLVSEYEADLVITDHRTDSTKPFIRIGSDIDADIKKPFSRSQLMIKLEDKLHMYEDTNNMKSLIEEKTPSLEEKITLLAEKFTKDILKIVEEHYAKK